MRDCYCAKCGMHFMMTEAFYDTMTRTEATFYCPAGHGNFYKIPEKMVEVPVVGTINEPDPPETGHDSAAARHLKLVKESRDAE